MTNAEAFPLAIAPGTINLSHTLKTTDFNAIKRAVRLLARWVPWMIITQLEFHKDDYSSTYTSELLARDIDLPSAVPSTTLPKYQTQEQGNESIVNSIGDLVRNKTASIDISGYSACTTSEIKTWDKIGKPFSKHKLTFEFNIGTPTAEAWLSFASVMDELLFNHYTTGLLAHLPNPIIDRFCIERTTDATSVQQIIKVEITVLSFEDEVSDGDA